VPAPDPTTIHPVAGQDRVVFLKPLIKSPLVTVGDYTYYDDPAGAALFEERNSSVASGATRRWTS
jgi:virginiamycin A acetyltransferase